VITGYNTDVEHNGIVYHVQTEDKGLQTPIILSLVYTGGEILASKRSPYDDLIADGFDQNRLAERLQRQHKLICAAVHAGRIEELKRMGERGLTTGALAPPAAQVREAGSALSSSDPPAPESAAPAESFTTASESEGALAINVMDDQQLRAGESVTLRIEVTKRARKGRVAAAKASITVRVLSNAFPPSSTYSTTDSAGRSAISVTLPSFKSGRAAVLIRAEAGGEVAEVRRIINPS
jgi:hypothetical protein